MKITFVFVKNKKTYAWLMDKLIMFFEGTNFSHTEIMVNDLICYGAEYPLSRKIDVQSWMKTYEIMHSFTVPEETDPIRIAEINTWLDAKLNEPYRIFDLFMILIDKITFGLLTKYYHENVYGLICSDFVGEFMEKFYGVKFNKDDALIGLPDVLEQAKVIANAKNPA